MKKNETIHEREMETGRDDDKKKKGERAHSGAGSIGER